jgi:hypothetical protein
MLPGLMYPDWLLFSPYQAVESMAGMAAAHAILARMTITMHPDRILASTSANEYRCEGTTNPRDLYLTEA